MEFPKEYKRGVSYRNCKQFVHGVCSWTKSLREVDEVILDDVEYVKDKFCK